MNDMSEREVAALQEEINSFRAEKEKIRMILGQIGGKNQARRARTVTFIFTAAIILLFILDVLRHFLGFDIPLPEMFSMAVGILLVSLKIIWMIHVQAKVGHFQFWILNSIEFRLNDMAKSLNGVIDRMEKLEKRTE